MKITYNNKFGTVAMSGNGDCSFSICDIDGIHLPGKDRTLIHFHNKDGYDETHSFYGQRVITISGDIKSNNYNELKKAIHIFSSPGTLTISTDYSSYQIWVNDITFKTQKKNNVYTSYCVQMTCDISHFYDCTDTHSGIYSRTPLITKNTFLPAVFTKRTIGGVVENNGNVICEPKIIIHCLSTTPEEPITIINKTTDKQITINYSATSGEIITIDIPKRLITSNINGDITSYLDAESYLCDMTLINGENEMDVITFSDNKNMEMFIIHRNLYTGVII